VTGTASMTATTIAAAATGTTTKEANRTREGAI
jgi:hypothetical protein